MSKRDSPSSFFSAPSKRVLVIDDEEDDDSSDCVVVSISTPHDSSSSSCDSFSDDESSDDSSSTPDLFTFLRDPAHRERVMYSQEDTALINNIMYGQVFTDFTVMRSIRRVRVTDTRDAPYMEQKPAPSQEYYNTQQPYTPVPNEELIVTFRGLRHEVGNYVRQYLCKDITREIGQYVQSA